MSVEKVEGGYKIRSHKTGKLYPKIYGSKEAAQERINQMESFKKSDDDFKFVILEKGRGPDLIPRKRKKEMEHKQISRLSEEELKSYERHRVAGYSHAGAIRVATNALAKENAERRGKNTLKEYTEANPFHAFKSLEKARSHKYIKRIGSKGKYTYVYRDPQGFFRFAGEKDKLSTPEEHQIKIARDTLKMPDAMAGVMGGPTKEEGERILTEEGAGRGVETLNRMMYGDKKSGPPVRTSMIEHLEAKDKERDKKGKHFAGLKDPYEIEKEDPAFKEGFRRVIGEELIVPYKPYAGKKITYDTLERTKYGKIKANIRYVDDDGVEKEVFVEERKQRYPYEDTKVVVWAEPTKKGRESEGYLKTKQELGDDWDSDITDFWADPKSGLSGKQIVKLGKILDVVREKIKG
ncbi:hypothetical protein A2Z67_02790 [Candidatus Woesebacteria bacterium RBG_13_36_22]|uniref:Uncharacterized protein n=1 Tax=Candidatus Woesebacteria bacterium RBG_13_36_22 TaxID=1802478 RepID=A0A1F7X843_9BACT|nr:MAG: hypothetical protein A2Z67_02790 [Candidatus Woesebacteria bacterium RBG_13_36_22]